MEIKPQNVFGKGYMTTEQIMCQNVPFSLIREWEENGLIIKADRGLYSLPGAERDELGLICGRYGKAVFSGITALSLWKMIDHISERYYVTFPKGYNPASLKDCGWNLSVTRVLPEIYDLGLTEIATPQGNTVRVYDRERTLCDILRGKGISPYLTNIAVKNYLKSKDRDVRKLLSYSDALHVRKRIEPYTMLLS